MSFFADIRSDLTDLFAEEPFVPSTITRETKGALNPATRRTSTGTTATLPCQAYVESAIVTAMDGTRTTSSTAMGNVAFVINDKLTSAGKTYTVTQSSGSDQTGFYEATVTA
jgi:hypothetical protein